MVTFNACILFMKINCPSSTPIVPNGLVISGQLLKKVSLPIYNCRRRSSISDRPLGSQAENWRHFPENIPPADSKQHLLRKDVAFPITITEEKKLHGNANNAYMKLISKVSHRQKLLTFNFALFILIILLLIYLFYE